ncbi:MAG: hypothetical protein JW850_14875 [Thermoflexales bacterium]|nr:hypothetical protein [Thermoflexales bacterium]
MPGLIFVLAVAASLSVTWGVLEAMPHLEDEFAQYFQAQVFASGRLWVPSPPQPASFLVPFAIDLDGRRFSKYPPGLAAVLALGLKAGASWLINPLAGALTLLVLYVLGRELFDAETGPPVHGVSAALLGLLSPMFLGLSATLLPHALCALCLLVFTWAVVQISRFTFHVSSFKFHVSIIGGLALGWAVLTRPYTALAYAAPFGLWAAWQIARGRRPAAAGAYAVMGLIAAAFAALLLVYNHALTGQYRTELYTLVWPYDRMGWGGGLYPGGHTLRVALMNARLDLWVTLTELLGWPRLSWLPLLLGLILPPRRRVEWALLAPFGALVLAQIAYWSHGAPLFGPRYYYEAMPLLWLLAARGLLKLWHLLAGHTKARALMAVALAVVVAVDVLGVLPARFAVWRGLHGITRQPRRQIAQQGLHNALVFVRIRHWGDYSELAWTNELSLDGDLVFALDEGEEANRAVVAAYPGRHVFNLADGVLTEVKEEP